jgi:hypothetical protein
MPTDLPIASKPLPRRLGFTIESPLSLLALVAVACGLGTAIGLASALIVLTVDWKG